MEYDKTRELTLKFVAAFNSHEPETVAKMLSADFFYSDPAAPVPTGNREAFVELQGAIFEAFPDIHFELTSEVISGEDAFLAFSTTATGRGKFGELDIAGRKIAVPEGVLIKCANGGISRMDFFSDTLRLARQIGMI